MEKSLYPFELNWDLSTVEEGIKRHYLHAAYEASKDSLYSHSIFQIIADSVQRDVKTVQILDLGCADKRSFRLLTNYGVKIERYCGVDYNSQFHPDINADVRELSKYKDQIHFEPNIILLTDVLEHLENGVEDIQKFLTDLKNNIKPGTKVYVSAPQMYRLDRYKLKHLFYSEHKVRLNISEWEGLIEKNLVIEEKIGVGYISVLPYLIMFFPFYKEDGWSGSIFKKFRNYMSKFVSVRKLDYFLSTRLANFDFTCKFSNSTLFVCRSKE